MNRWRVGEDTGSKEMDRCPFTYAVNITSLMPNSQWSSQVNLAMNCEP
jgi:hypothetical protein